MDKMIVKEKELEIPELTIDIIHSMIYEVRGIKVMLDFDLSKIYGYSTKHFNQQVKNNIDKFDSDFMFQLTKEEYKNILRLKNLTSNRGGNRYLPYAFTEEGIYMLMTVLKGDLATTQSKALIRTFKKNNNRFHDRYIIIDYKTDNEKLFHCGSSSKDAGNKITTITKIE